MSHFLIQPDPEGVRLQGWNERAFSEEGGGREGREGGRERERKGRKEGRKEGGRGGWEGGRGGREDEREGRREGKWEGVKLKRTFCAGEEARIRRACQFVHEL